MYRDFMKNHMLKLGIENPCLSSKYRLKKIGMLWQIYKQDLAISFFFILPFNILTINI